MEKLDRMIQRNLIEILHALQEWRALVGLEGINGYHEIDFFQICWRALFNDAISHTIKVLDTDIRSATFWTLYNRFKKPIDEFVVGKKINLDEIKIVSTKLKLIRNKTHFHIDKKRVVDPAEAWREADIRAKELEGVIEQIYDILKYIYFIHFGEEFNYPDYRGEDAKIIAKLAINNYNFCESQLSKSQPGEGGGQAVNCGVPDKIG